MHKFEDGNHRRTKCNYCSKDNHYEWVCLNKVLGKPKAEQVRATDILSLTTSSSSSSDSSNSEALVATKTNSPFFRSPSRLFSEGSG